MDGLTDLRTQIFTYLLIVLTNYTFLNVLVFWFSDSDELTPLTILCLFSVSVSFQDPDLYIRLSGHVITATHQ